MTLLLHPISTYTVYGYWSYSSGDSSSAYQLVNDDDDETQLNTQANGAYATFNLATPAQIPTNKKNHKVYARGKYSGTAKSRVVELYQGGTLIKSFPWTLGTSYETTCFELTEAEASAITDYSLLRIRVRQVTYAFNCIFYVTKLYLEIPDTIGLEMGCSF